MGVELGGSFHDVRAERHRRVRLQGGQTHLVVDATSLADQLAILPTRPYLAGGVGDEVVVHGCTAFLAATDGGGGERRDAVTTTQVICAVVTGVIG